MKTKFLLITSSLLLAVQAPAQDLAPQQIVQQQEEIPNALINFPGFLEDADDVVVLRMTRRVTEEECIQMAAEPETIILDTRSREAYDQKHIAGAVHLNFSDFTEEKLAKVIPDQNTRILIYCNNNFTNNSPAFPSKVGRAALNIPTFIALHSYEYQNVYELGPAVDEDTTALPFAGSSIEQPAHKGALPALSDR